MNCIVLQSLVEFVKQRYNEMGLYDVVVLVLLGIMIRFMFEKGEKIKVKREMKR